MDANTAVSWVNDNKMVANRRKFQLKFLARKKSIEKATSFV